MKFCQIQHYTCKPVKNFLLSATLAVFGALIGINAVSAFAAPSPQQVTLGSYLTSLYDIDNDNGTFSADIWVWTKTKFKYNIGSALETSLFEQSGPPLFRGFRHKTLKKW